MPICPLRTLDDPADLDRYLHLKAEVKRLTTEMKALEPVILNSLMDEDGDRAEHLGCVLEVRSRRRWSYSSYVDELAAELKATKKLEEANGTASLEAITSHIAVTLADRRSAPRQQGTTA
ncbi:MAG: hypothetical protein AAGG50_03060 [Bacteroidota bacterium]